MAVVLAPLSCLILCLVNLQLVSVAGAGSSRRVEMRMPDVVSSKPDDLVCHSYHLNESVHQYVVAYQPIASRQRAHHLMVYGCKKPASTENSWTCGGTEREEAGICEEQERRIVYAWALDAPSIELPSGVGLRVGGDTGIDYLVLQLHYKKQFQDGERDNSGVVLTLTDDAQMQMGFYILGNWGYIPPHRHAFHMESACHWQSNYTAYPFAYRTHSHQLGRVTSAYRLRDSEWTEIGRMSPQQPETFYPVTSAGVDLKGGDIMAARCTMNSWGRDEPTVIGPTNHDEMCNFYLMYYTHETRNLQDIYCFKDAQKFHWDDYFTETPRLASTLHGVVLPQPDMEPRNHMYMRR